MTKTIIDLLKQSGLKDTQPRRLVVRALERIKQPSSPYDIQKWIAKQGDKINAVTVYRILEAFETLNIVHRHACNGQYSLCSQPDIAGHHGFLHCQDCGRVEEFADTALCRAENAVAQRAGFRPIEHVSEILGLCRTCTR